MEKNTGEPVVVGFDGTPDAEYALEWAADHARIMNLPLRVVTARGELHTLSAWADQWTRGLAVEWGVRARKVLDGAAFADADAEIVVRDGMPADVLTRESAHASLVVVGSHGHAVLLGLFQGSVSQHVARHAACPVMVVRPPADEAATSLVVGVDGSAASLDALAFGLDLAKRRGWNVSVIYCPQRWAGYGDERPTELAPELLAEFETRERDVQRRIHEAGRLVGVDVELHEVSGHPSQALTDASRSTALLVVGARGHGGFPGLVLGSVSADMIRHAHCPVVVVR